MPGNIVVEQIKLVNNLFKLIIAVVVIDEPSLYSKPGVIGDPLPQESCLVP
ncbi:hypothetical protein OIU76_014346 [Salix suchowensis]|nr:hypothetical protein OIU76_014346 [Salix suchowensis]